VRSAPDGARVRVHYSQRVHPRGDQQQAGRNRKQLAPRLAACLFVPTSQLQRKRQDCACPVFPQRAGAACCGNADSQRLRPEQARSSTFTAMQTASTRSSTENTLKRKPRRRPSRSTRNSSPASRGSSHGNAEADDFRLHQSHGAVGCHRRAKKRIFKLWSILRPSSPGTSRDSPVDMYPPLSWKRGEGRKWVKHESYVRLRRERGAICSASLVFCTYTPAHSQGGVDARGGRRLRCCDPVSGNCGMPFPSPVSVLVCVQAQQIQAQTQAQQIQTQ
jgi:hypothetical protein